MSIIKDAIRTIPDFPIKGIMFRDVTTILNHPEAFDETMRELSACADKLGDADVFAGAESRGFIFAAPLAWGKKKAFVPIRKPGKLPFDTYKETYDLEYGQEALEIHTDAILPGQKVIIVDDLLATGGTAKAMAKLVERCGGIVLGFLFVVELPDLKGRYVLSDYPMHALVQFEGE